MQDDKNNCFIKCSICGAIGNWSEMINGGFCHDKSMNRDKSSNDEISTDSEDNEEFTEKELEEIMEEYGDQRP